MRAEELVKENVVARPPLALWWLVAGVAASAAALAGVALIDVALPEPLLRATAPPDRFIAENAYDHLVNLTAIGPRVAGSYENEVLAVGAVVAAVRRIAREASPHNRVELDVFTASGAFPLAFMDGMNNVYRDVSGVVARVSAVGAPPPRHQALLFNCHYDTVPDSPGASDDAAGCAVLLETMRALAATRRPLRHAAIFLFNGAEENIMQASHGFITSHKWAASVRAFVNIEACGAGGREVMFQAGPRDPWLVEAYAAAVPHPFASSLAQELFQSGLIPADTDFRIFRDFGRLSGVDLAWSSNGYVYHTRLDTADRVPRAALQRTGDNVLALAHGLLSGERLESAVEPDARQPAYFDVLGLFVVCLRAPAAAAAAVAALALVALDLRLAERDATRTLYVSRAAWRRAVLGGCAALGGAGAAGVAAAALVAAALHAAGAPLAAYSRPWLLAPLYALPALGAAWAALARLHRPAAPVRGWWAARALHAAGAALAAGALALCAALRLRSGFVPLLWAALPAAGDSLGGRLRGGRRALLWAAAALPAALQTWYLALGSLRMLVPLAGRAGARALPADVPVAALVAAATLAATAWLLPLVVVTRRVNLLVWAACGLCAAAALAARCGGAYGADSPQRLMVFHTRRTVHAPPAPPATDTYYWIPALDDNSPHAAADHVPALRAARPAAAAACLRWPYCGAPYYLPVRSLVPRSHELPARSPPLARLRVNATRARLNATADEITLDLAGPAHIVVALGAGAGGAVSWSSLVAAPAAGGWWGSPPRRQYFFLLHRARAAPPPAPPAAWRLRLAASGGPLAVVAAGHAMFGAARLAPDHARLLAAMPPWVAATGWGVDLHLLEV